MTDRKLRVAMFGAGDFGPHFARYVNAFAELVAVCDPDPAGRARFARETGLDLREFDHPARLLAETDVDAVVITSPNHTHNGHAIFLKTQKRRTPLTTS